MNQWSRRAAILFACATFAGCGEELFKDVPGVAIPSCEEGTHLVSRGPSGDVCAPHTECEPGQYETRRATVWADRLCSPCVTGFYCRGWGEEPAPCQEGWSCPPGLDNPQCDEGRWINVLERTCLPITECEEGVEEAIPPTTMSDRVCSDCGAGRYLDLETEECFDYTVCLPGEMVSTPPSGVRDRECAPCLEGHHCSTENSSPVPFSVCEPGTHLVAEGTPSSDALCDPCPAGNYCPGQAQEPVPCTAANATGAYCPEGASAPIPLTECETGTAPLVEPAGDGSDTEDVICCPVDPQEGDEIPDACAADPGDPDPAP